MPLLEVKNLTVGFNLLRGEFLAVHGTDINIDEGEILAIVGESGSGKSVSMLALMGLLPWNTIVKADKMSFAGKDLRDLPIKKHRQIVGKNIAMIFQEPMSSLNPCFTVGFQIREALQLHTSLSRKEQYKRAIELFEQVGIADAEKRLKNFPHQLSGGMNQRAMIAMAIACQPRLLIADEPTTALDVTIQAQILDLLKGLQKNSNMAMILITHDMGVVAETADRVCVQYAGQKVEEQGVKQLFKTPKHPYTAALLDSLPERAKTKYLPVIKGIVPDYFDRPNGCLFSPRCKYVKDKCRNIMPDITTYQQSKVRCHYPLAQNQNSHKMEKKN